MLLADGPAVRILRDPLLLRVLLFAAWLGILVATFSNASAVEPEVEAGQASLIEFDIPAQPLDEALFAYTDKTGLSVLFEDGLVSGRQSAKIKGSFTPADALKGLLSGTGLEIRYTALNAFTLVPSVNAASGSGARDASRDEAYFREVQTAVKRVLCSRSQTLPGQYRLGIQLWIDAAGVVLRSAFLGSSGSRDRDRLLFAMLDGLPIGTAPPAGLPQPVTLVILPRAPNATDDCGPADEAAPMHVRG